MIDWREPLVPYLVPRLDTLTLYAYALPFVLIFAASHSFRTILHPLVIFPPIGWILLPMLAYGLAVSLLTVLTNRKTRPRDKFFMFFFALGSNALLTLYAMFQASAERASFGWRDIPLAVSTLYTIAIIGLWNNDLFSEQDIIDDSKATPTQVLFVTVPVVLTALLTSFLFHLEWYIAYAWCLTTGFTFKSLAPWMFPKPYGSD